MAGRLDPCFLISLAVDPRAVEHLLPAGLELLVHRRTAFWNIVVCRVRRLRLLGAPGLFGLTYWHVAHRLHVAATARNGRRWPGLFFLRSDIDRAILTAPGNWLTDFRFHCVEIRIDERPGWFRLEMGRNDDGLASGSIEIDRNGGHPAVSPHPFDSLEERERVLRYTPSGLAVDPAATVLRIAEVDRDERRWRESPVALVHCEFSYLRDQMQDQVRVVRATEVAPIDYVWTLGTRVAL